MGSPSGVRGPLRERDGNSTVRSGSRRRRKGGGGGGVVGPGVLSSGNNVEISWQPSLMGRLD